MAGIRGSWQGSMFACDVAMAFASITSAGLPGVLIKITSGSSHMLILGALKDGANTSACSWEVGEGSAFICVPLCGRDVCVCCALMCMCGCKEVFFFLLQERLQQLLGRRQRILGGGWRWAVDRLSAASSVVSGHKETLSRTATA